MEYQLTRAGLLVGAGASLLGAPHVRTWRGTYRLPAAAEGVPISLELRGARARVALGPGHASLVETAVRRRGSRLQLQLPGRPGPLVLDALQRRDGRLEGEARQGRAGGALDARAVGAYRLPDGGTLGVVGLVGNSYGVAYERDEIHRLYPAGAGAWWVGAGVDARTPPAGAARIAGTGLRWLGESAARV